MLQRKNFISHIVKQKTTQRNQKRTPDHPSTDSPSTLTGRISVCRDDLKHKGASVLTTLARNTALIFLNFRLDSPRNSISMANADNLSLSV